MTDIVSAKQRRKLAARHDPPRTIWFGLGMFGLVGWSIAVPTLIGVATGIWIDRKWPGRQSWTMMLMLTGLAVGCYHAWRWVYREGELHPDSTATRKPTEDASELKESQEKRP